MSYILQVRLFKKGLFISILRHLGIGLRYDWGELTFGFTIYKFNCYLRTTWESNDE